MTLSQFKALLAQNRDKNFHILLPNGDAVPQSFHVTEIGLVSKTFIDCGGKIHSAQICQLQVWLGPDEDHRLSAGKLADILQMARKIVPNDDLELEIEYEAEAISQYPILDFETSEDAVILNLTTKHTDCLAKELCLVEADCGCGPAGCC